MLLVPVDLVTWWVEEWTVLAMALKLLLQDEKTEAEFTEEEAVDVMVVYGVRTIIPCL